jgi:hypothetical protein
MSKAEEFIKAKTRIGSNTTKGWRRNGVSIPLYSLPWLTPDEARKAVEIAREDVIEKVCEFLENDLCCYIKAQDFAIEHQRLENDLKQAMKDET